ncbi:MAG: beta-galactosidase [Acetobacteraceae bacterium]|nr:beta-galactosidase [Acetobacteraceae bacterium]
MSPPGRRLSRGARRGLAGAGLLIAIAVAAAVIALSGQGDRGGKAAELGNHRFAHAAASCTPSPSVTRSSGTGSTLLLGVSASIRVQPAADRCEEARLAAETGVEAVREDLSWAQAEPRENRYDWSSYDGVVRAAIEARLTVLPILDDPPSWASSGAGCLPTDPRAYASFTAAAVARYGPGGAFWRDNPDLPERPLQWYELWNEPWNAPCDRDPAVYARLVVAAVNAGRDTSSAVRFLIDGDTFYTTLGGQRADWIAGMYAAVPSLGKYFDALSIHPYGGDPTVQTPGGDTDNEPGYLVERAHVELVAHGDGDKPLWVTEIGWSTCSGASACVTEAQQASYLAEFLHAAVTTWRSFVRAVFVYDLRDIAPAPANDPEAWYGLLRPDLSPKPAWSVLRSFSDQLHG